MARFVVWYAVAVVLVVTFYYAVPAARLGLAGTVELLAVAVIEYWVRRWRPQRAWAWHALALSVALIAIGDFIFAAFEARSAAPVPFPTLPHLFYIVAYLPLTVALFWLGQTPTGRHGLTSFVDAVIVTLAGSLVVWTLVVSPELQGLTAAGRFAVVGAWVGFIAVFTAAARLVFFWRRNVSVGLLSIAVVAFLVAEIFYGHELVRGTWRTGGPVNLGYFAFAMLCGAAALHPSMRNLASPAYARHTLGPQRLTIIAVALLVGPTALLVEASLGVVETAFAIGIITALVSVLMLVRLAMAGRAYQRRAAREHAVRLASQAMVSAITLPDAVAGTRDALRVAVREHHAVEVTLADPYHPEAHRQPPAEGPAPPNEDMPSGPADRGELAVPLTGSETALVFAAPTYVLDEFADLLRALTDQAALALQRIRLAEAAGAEERHRYFRTLVHTSTDVILISRDGRIEYATPSAEGLFGRDVLGERFDDIVRPVRPADLGPPEEQAAPDNPLWPNTTGGTEATITHPGGKLTVLVQRRDLTGEPSVGGVVTTMRDITAEQELRRDLSYRASHDELTGLANVRAWGETLAAEGDRRHERGDAIAVLLVDVDNFKGINDRHGHPAGDEVLTEVARRIRARLRADDRAARIGGDEFAVLLRGLSSVDDARAAAQRLADALSHPVMVDSVAVDCHASVGLSYTEGTERVRTLVRQADAALYTAKGQGKGQWTEYHPEQGPSSPETPNGSQNGGAESS